MPAVGPDVADVEAEPHLGGLVADRLDVRQRRPGGLRVGDVAPAVGDVVAEVVGLAVVGRRVEVVEHHDVVADVGEDIDDARADEARASGDQDLRHGCRI